MWFKNLALYRFTEAFTVTPETLENQLQQRSFRPCGSLEPASYGWTAPLGRNAQQLLHTSNGFMLLCAQKEEKILPASVVNELVTERLAQLEESQGRKPRKSERDSIRDEVTLELLPRAFSHSRRTYGYIDPQGGWLIVDASSAKKAEEFSSYLRKTIGTLAVTPPVTQQTPVSTMTQWLLENDAPSDLTIEDECELRSPDEDGGIVRCKRHDLFSNEIRNHLDAGKEVIKLALSWNDRLSFVLEDSGAIKRLRFLDLIQEQAAEIDAEDEHARFDADFSIMSLELAEFLPRLLELLGGETPQTLQYQQAEAIAV